MKLSINLHSIADVYGFEKSIDIYKAAGFDAIDYSLMRMVYDDNPMNGTNYRELAREVRRVVEKKGMTVNQTHAPFGFKPEQWDQEELFEGVRALPWENWIGKDDAFPVKGHAIRSQLFSLPDCQSIVKKAIVERLAEHYGIRWFAEEGSKYHSAFELYVYGC